MRVKHLIMLILVAIIISVIRKYGIGTSLNIWGELIWSLLIIALLVVIFKKVFKK